MNLGGLHRVLIAWRDSCSWLKYSQYQTQEFTPH
jgi:hypothetical protein